MNYNFDWIDVSFIKNRPTHILKVPGGGVYRVEEKDGHIFVLSCDGYGQEKEFGTFDTIDLAKKFVEEYYIEELHDFLGK